MNFLVPGMFALGLLAAVIVALYLLKLRRTDRPVSSIYLWRQMVRDVEANAPWQRLRWNPLMLLQLLILAALVFSLARPVSYQAGVKGESIIFILDNSASMQAVDVAPSRLEAAKDRAIELLNGLPDGVRVTVITAGAQARVLLSSSQDRMMAQTTLKGIEPESGGSDMAVALELANAIASRQSDTGIVILSDGRFTLPDYVTLKASLEYIPLGNSDENTAISQLSLEGEGGGQLRAFAQVTNYSSEASNRRLTVYADDVLVNAFNLEIPPEESQVVLIDDLPADTQILRAELDAGDILRVDDVAHAVRGEVGERTVLLVSEGNHFIRTALRLLPGVNLVEALPGEELVYGEDTGLVIFDSFVPQTRLPRINLLFIAPPASTNLFTVTGLVEQPIARPVDVEDPILQYTSLPGVNILDAVEIPLPDWAIPVVAGDTAEGSIPLLFRGRVRDQRVAVLAFDLHHSDLPLNVTFPILWSNLVSWLFGDQGAGGGFPTAVSPGETFSVQLPAEVETVNVTRPDGTVRSMETEMGNLVFNDTTQSGLYRVKWSDGEAFFAANLFSPLESDPLPQQMLDLVLSAEGGAEGEGQARQEWWRITALIALVVLMVEWLFYHRAGLVQFKDRLVRQLNARTSQTGGRRRGA